MQKLIYVKSEDEPLIEQAQEMFDESLSAVIISSLREYVERHKTGDGYQSVTIRVGKLLSQDGGGAFRKIHFLGRLLAEYKAGSRTMVECEGVSEFDVYKTSDSNFVLVVKEWDKDLGDGPINFWHTCRVFRAGSLGELREKYSQKGKESIDDLISIAEEALLEMESDS